jgi:hypothetical protein
MAAVGLRIDVTGMVIIGVAGVQVRRRAATEKETRR